jgi:hypothetical protein
MQPRDLLALVSLLFRDFVDCSPRTLELRVLFGPIRLGKQAELPVLPRQPPPQVRNRRLNRYDVDVRMLRKEFGNLSPEFDEVEFLCE